MDYVDIIIELENENEKTDVRVIEEKEKSVIILISIRYSDSIYENEMKYEKKPIIYFGNRLVKDYIRLPYENVYDDDEELGKICLFPRSKYEFVFE